MPHPPCSSDLNPIEHVWAILKHRIQHRRSRPLRRADIIIAIQEEWNRLTSDDFERIIESMPRRVQAVLAANGGHTR